MTIHRKRLALSILSFCFIEASLLNAKEPADASTFLNAQNLQFTSIMPPPPVPGSDAEKTDLAKFAEVRAGRTPQEVERATREQKDSAFDFAEVLGSNFTAANLPKTAQLFAEVTKEAKTDVTAAKMSFQRPRPTTPEADDEAKNSGKETDKYSYPSGHSTRAFVWASLLAELFPDQKEALMKVAQRKAWDRVVLGKHFPADVLAGRIYGEFLAKELLKNETFQKEWGTVRQEIDTFKSTVGKSDGKTTMYKFREGLTRINYRIAYFIPGASNDFSY